MPDEPSLPPSSLQDVLARTERALESSRNDRFLALERRVEAIETTQKDCIKISMFRPYLKLLWGVLTATTVPAGAAIWDFLKNHVR